MLDVESSRALTRWRTLRKCACLAYPTLLGAALGLYLVGLERINPYNLSWLWGDLVQVYAAWVGARESGTGFLQFTQMSYPLPIDVALFDPMPLFILVARPFSSFIPNSTQFFGCYFVLGLALQAMFGALALDHALGADSRLSLGLRRACTIALSLLFAAAPYTMLRLLGHTALSSHWMLVMGIWLCLKYGRESLPKWVGIHGTALFAITGINPYIALMAAMSPVAITIVDTVRGQVDWLSAAIRITALGLVMFTGLYLFGFTSGVGDSLPFGYGFYSMNLLGPFDSNGDASLLRLDVPDATGGQAGEGYQYQGLGLFALVLVGAMSFKAKPSESSFPFAAALLVVAVSYTLALSNVVTLGGNVIATVPLPRTLLQLLGHFRASGRFFWIGGLWLIVIGAAGIVVRFKGMQLAAVIGAVLTLQIADLWGVVANVRGRFAGMHGFRLNPAQFGPALTRARAFTILPPFQCGPEASPGGVWGFEPFAMLSAESSLPINSFYAARTPTDQTRYHCEAQHDLLRFGAEADRIYALTPAVFQTYRTALSSHTCKPSAETGRADFPHPAPRLADIILCIPTSGATMQLGREFTWSFGAGAYGTTMLAGGWHLPEDWGVWSDGPRSRLVIPISHLEPSKSLRITLQFRVFTVPAARPYQSVRIALQGITLFSGEFGPERGNSTSQVTVRVDRGLLLAAEYVLLDLDHPDATSPERLGAGSDTRNLAIGLVSADVSAEH
jgi:hypothetical protein